MDRIQRRSRFRDLSLAEQVQVSIALGGGLGLARRAPGTVGSLAGLPLAWGVGQLAAGWQLAVIGVLFVLGVGCCQTAARHLGGAKDPGCIVWDEIASFPVVFWLIPLTHPAVAAAGFALHRLFDITKPPPAAQAERFPRGWGIMADDVVAAIYANLALRACLWLYATVT